MIHKKSEVFLLLIQKTSDVECCKAIYTVKVNYFLGGGGATCKRVLVLVKLRKMIRKSGGFSILGLYWELWISTVDSGVLFVCK